MTHKRCLYDFYYFELIDVVLFADNVSELIVFRQLKKEIKSTFDSMFFDKMIL